MQWWKTRTSIIQETTGKDLIKILGFDDDFFKGMTGVKQAMQDILSVEDSDEMKAAMAIMTSGIPHQAKEMSDRLKDIFQKGGPQKLLQNPNSRSNFIQFRERYCQGTC